MRITCFLEKDRENDDTIAHSCLDLYIQIIAVGKHPSWAVILHILRLSMGAAIYQEDANR
jgi:hypothetical protein